MASSSPRRAEEAAAAERCPGDPPVAATCWWSIWSTGLNTIVAADIRFDVTDYVWTVNPGSAKITMSAFEGTPLDIVLRDCGVRAYLIAGVETEVGIEPTVRHSTDLGYIPVVVRDACGAGDEAAGRRALESLAFAGVAILTDTDEVCSLLASGG